jgi:hypothetical protein
MADCRNGNSQPVYVRLIDGSIELLLGAIRKKSLPKGGRVVSSCERGTSFL